jgi:hypothetical protein
MCSTIKEFIMRKTTIILMTVASLIIGTTGYTQTIAPPYEVGTWPGFCTAAVSYTFDDGSPNQFAKAIPMFNEFGYQLTLFTVTGTSFSWPPDWTALQNAASQGHEIASHTVTHTSLGGMNDSLQTMELKDSQYDIDAHITGQRCITLAYPFCVAGKKSLCAQYYIAARICSGSIVPPSPGDFMNISSIICGELGSVKTTKNFINIASTAVNSKGWCVFLIHGIDSDGGWSSLPSDTLRKSLEYLNANRDKFWVSTFGNVACYIKERNAVSVTESSFQDSSITVQVTDTLDNAIYNHPVTLRRPLLQGWPSAVVSQNGRSVDVKIVDINSIQYIQFDAVPDSGDVVISRSNTTGVQNHRCLTNPVPTSSQNYPNPFNPTTTIEFSLPERSEVRMVLVNLSGQVVKELAAGSFAAGIHQVKLDASGLAGGVYFYKLKAGNLFEVKKLVLIR